jgi:hypothetical protein
MRYVSWKEAIADRTMAFAISYTERPLNRSDCEFDSRQHVTLTLEANPKHVIVQTVSRRGTFTWDGQLDFVCGDEDVRALQIGPARDMVRVNFMFDNSPFSAREGVCMSGCSRAELAPVALHRFEAQFKTSE